jgi:hypothetical protein
MAERRTRRPTAIPPYQSVSRQRSVPKISAP